jgi:hypothetical protein
MAGRPKTFDKERQRLALREQVWAAQDRMTQAQIDSACGIKYLVSRDRKSGKFTKITADQAAQILSANLAPGEDSAEIIEVWEERPSTQAYTDLINRANDKPTEHVEQTVTIQDLGARILAARKRVKPG